VTLLGRRERLSLALAAGLAVAADDLSTADFESAFATPSVRLREYLADFDRIVVWMRDEDSLLQSALASSCRAEVQTHSGLPPEDWGQHASRWYCAALGLDWPDPPRLAISPSAEAYDVIIHPGSGGRIKNWPLANFVEVAEALHAQGRRVVWSLGPAEEGWDLPGKGLPTESLVDRAARLASAKLYIGNDSGITHLAAAVGCPTIAIFGPTNPAVWAPLGDNVSVLTTPTPEEVLAACGEMQSCAKNRNCGCGVISCTQEDQACASVEVPCSSFCTRHDSSSQQKA
jgi:hypothetical protein